MVHRCCISSCGMNVRVLEAKGLSYHKFPTKEPIRDQWVQAIIPHLDKPETFKVVPRYTRVCSRHFRKKDYCMDAKKRARLNSNAVPSVFPRKGTPLVVPTVLPVSPKCCSKAQITSPDCVPKTSPSSTSVKSDDKTGQCRPVRGSSTGSSDEATTCTIPHVSNLEGRQLDDLLQCTELVIEIESASIQDDHLVLTVMDPHSLHGEAQDSVSIYNSDDQSQSQAASPNAKIAKEEWFSGDGTGTKRRKRRKWNRTAFARPAKGKRKSMKTDPVSPPAEEEEESETMSKEVGLLSTPSVSIEDTGSMGHNEADTSLTNVTLLFSDLPNQSYQVASVEQELLQSIQAVSLKSGGETEEGSELHNGATDETFPYNNLIPAFLHHSSEESLFSNESQNAGGPNDYNFHPVSGSQPEPDLSNTAEGEDDSLRFELVDLRIDPEIPSSSAPPPSYLDIDELAHQLNSSLFTDGKIPLFSTDTLGDSSAANLNIAEDLFTDTTEDITPKRDPPASCSAKEVPSIAVPPPPISQGHTSRSESKQSLKKGATPRNKGKTKSTKSPPPPPPPPPVKEKKLKGVSKRPKKDKVSGKFSVERFKGSDKDIEYYTGFTTFRSFDAFFRSLEAYIEKLCITDATYGVNYLPSCVDKSGNCPTSSSTVEESGIISQKPSKEPPKKRSCQGRAMSRINELFMTIIRLRRKLPEKVLGHMFFISQPTVSRVVRAWTVLLSKIIDSYPVDNPSSSKGQYKEHAYTSKGLGVPEVFRELFYSDLAKSIVVTSLNPKKVKVKSKSPGSSSVRNKKSKMSSTAGASTTDLDSSSQLSDPSEDRSGDVDSDYFGGVNANTSSPIEHSSLFEF